MFSKSEGLGQRTETGNVGTSGRGRQQCPARVSQLHCSYSVALGPWSCWGRWQRSPTCCTLSERIDEDKILLHKGTNKEARLSLPWVLEDKKKKFSSKYLWPQACSHAGLGIEFILFCIYQKAMRLIYEKLVQSSPVLKALLADGRSMQKFSLEEHTPVSWSSHR